jgi:sirohydrochlorin ferrochelatase
MIGFSTEGRTATGRPLFKDKPKKAKEQPQDTRSAIQFGEHGRYQIKSGRLAGEYVARAFPKPPTNARGMIAEARGATEEAAIAALHEVIDAREIRRTEERRIDPETGSAVPSAEEYAEAIAQVALTRPQRAMLTALALADGDGLPEVRVAYVAGYKSQSSANRAFAAAGLLFASYLSVDVRSTGGTSDLEGTVLMGFRGERPNDGDPGNWILHPELRKAVRSVL